MQDEGSGGGSWVVHGLGDHSELRQATEKKPAKPHLSRSGPAAREDGLRRRVLGGLLRRGRAVGAVHGLHAARVQGGAEVDQPQVQRAVQRRLARLSPCVEAVLATRVTTRALGIYDVLRQSCVATEISTCNEICAIYPDAESAQAERRAPAADGGGGDDGSLTSSAGGGSSLPPAASSSSETAGRRSKFSGLTSRCVMLRACSDAKASSVCFRTLRMNSSPCAIEGHNRLCKYQSKTRLTRLGWHKCHTSRAVSTVQ